MRDQAHTLPFDLSDFLPFQMSVIASRTFQRIMEDTGLQVPEWRIMMALPAHQPCSSHDLCILTAMDAARVSRAQRRLEDLEMISAVRPTNDRRRLVRAAPGNGDGRLSAASPSRGEVEKQPLHHLGTKESRQPKEPPSSGLLRTGSDPSKQPRQHVVRHGQPVESRRK